MSLRPSRAVTVRLALGEPVIPDVAAATLPERFRGKPKIDSSRCPEGCSKCVDECPTCAISLDPLTIDLGACVFCPLCTEACPEGALTYTNEYKVAASSREGLLLRSVSAGGCNGCELELNALGNVNFDMGRFGIEFVASPRHADGVVVSGTTTRAMANALESTYQAMPGPKLLILFGACAISGGIFQGSNELEREFIKKHKIDLYIPGCPPHPLTFIHGLLQYLRKLPVRHSSNS
jgi:Ni,Fe-hydrogenase III small subunit/NAD-dependent dihydropyrimidine dehydrogenase PreA subunit